MKKTRFIFVSIFFYYFAAQSMEKENIGKTKPLPIHKVQQKHLVSESYYGKILAMLSGQSWDSDLNYSTHDDTLGGASVFSETDVDMSGSISFESKNSTPLSSPRKHIEQHKETGKPQQEKNLFYRLCCCFHRKQVICYEEIR